jgi:hypothetical protein
MTGFIAHSYNLVLFSHTTLWHAMTSSSFRLIPGSVQFRVQSYEYFTTGGLLPVLATRSLRPTTRIFFIFQLNTCGYSPHVTSCLTRGWVCRLQLLLVLASALILRSESHGTHGYMLMSQIRDSSNPEGQVPVFISPGNMVAWWYLLRLAVLRWRYSTLLALRRI